MSSLAIKIAWRLVLYPVIIMAAVSFAFFWMYAHPRRYIGEHKPKDFGLTEEPLALRTTDGISLDAWFIPNETSKKAIVICHGFPMDKSDVLGLTSFLARDFNLLYFDFRATGRSGGFFCTGGARETYDIDAAIKFLSGRGFREAGVFGFSMGASAALLSGNPAIKARVLDSPYASLSGELDFIFSGWGFLRGPLTALIKAWNYIFTGVGIGSVNPVTNTAAYAAPMLLIHGDADTTVPHSNSLAIKAANPAAELYIVEGASHGEAHYKALSKYESRVRDFFLKHL